MTNEKNKIYYYTKNHEGVIVPFTYPLIRLENIFFLMLLEILERILNIYIFRTGKSG